MLKGFKKFLEEDNSVVSGLEDEFGVSSKDAAQYFSMEPIILANVKLPDGTFHSLLPVKIVPGSINNKTATVVVDNTESWNLNDKVLRKKGDKMQRVPDWEREAIKFVIPLNTKTKNGTTLQAMLSQGWMPALNNPNPMEGIL